MKVYEKCNLFFNYKKWAIPNAVWIKKRVSDQHKNK